MSASPHVIDVTEATFNDEVGRRSEQTPVVIDFWAEWCGPCKTLGPALEGLADDCRGAFVLAKIDVDQSPRIAQYFGAQSIPTVMAVYQGQIVDQFVGALPKQEVKRWIDGVLERCGVEVPQEETVPTDPEEAEAFWRGRLDKDESDGEALLALGRLLLTEGRKDEAREFLTKVGPEMPEFNAAQAALALDELAEQIRDAGGEEAVRERARSNPDDAEATYLGSLADAVEGDFAGSLSGLVDLAGTGPKEVRDRAKKAAATILEAAGRDDERVEEQRRRLARVLF
ncbi:MAG: thioredoxin [Myxococcota bacterium]